MGDSLPKTGQKTMAASTPVVIASDQSTLPVRELGSSTATRTVTAASLTVVTLLAANTGRLSARLRNTSVTAAIFVKYGSAATTSDYDEVVLANDFVDVIPGYRGVITGIWSVASGSCIATEVA